jgi:hypothetical protein
MNYSILLSWIKREQTERTILIFLGALQINDSYLKYYLKTKKSSKSYYTEYHVMKLQECEAPGWYIHKSIDQNENGEVLHQSLNIFQKLCD